MNLDEVKKQFEVCEDPIRSHIGNKVDVVQILRNRTKNAAELGLLLRRDRGAAAQEDKAIALVERAQSGALLLAEICDRLDIDFDTEWCACDRRPVHAG